VGRKQQDDNTMNPVTAPVGEALSIVGTCINCTAPASLLATLAVLAIGLALAFRAERRSGTSTGT
jgi:ABC-type Na+ efflux pump permease subunit